MCVLNDNNNPTYRNDDVRESLNVDDAIIRITIVSLN